METGGWRMLLVVASCVASLGYVSAASAGTGAGSRQVFIDTFGFLSKCFAKDPGVKEERGLLEKAFVP